jgi:hypothetical protein
MELKNRALDAAEFRLVLTPDREASFRATQAVRERFRTLTETTRKNLAAVLTELVENSVERGPGRPITLTLVLRADSIRGEVADHGNPVGPIPQIKSRGERNGDSPALIETLTSRWGVYEGTTDVWFEIPLAHQA